MPPKKRKSSQSLGDGKPKAAKPSDPPGTEGDTTEWIRKLTAWHFASLIISVVHANTFISEREGCSVSFWLGTCEV